MIIVFAFIIFVAAPVLGSVLYFLYRIFFCSNNLVEPVPYYLQAAGRIHLFKENRHYNSSPDNPYEHPSLNWSDGRIGCALSCELDEHPEYRPAVIGKIEVLKPERDKGIVAVILDNEIVAELGLPLAGLVSGAQMLVDRANSASD